MARRTETMEDIVSEMARLQGSLPARPGPEEVQIAQQTLSRVDAALATRLEELFSQPRPAAVPNPVFRAFQEMREDVLRSQAQADKRMAMATMEIETRHRHYEALLQRVQTAASHPIHNSPVGNGVLNEYNRDGGSSHSASEKFNTSLPAVSEDGTVPETGSNFLDTRYSTPSASRTGTESWWSSPVLSSNGASNAMSRDTSSAGLARSRGPSTAPGSQKLESLNLSSKAISWLPESIGLVTNLTSLDLSGNRLQTLPESIGELSRLTFLDVQSNQLKKLPEALGCLTNLTTLSIQKNYIEELPWTIGLCTSLVEFNADFNQLKALPEAIGHLKSLQRLSVHLNSLKSLPTTMSSLTNLTDLDVHFNHLESIPQSLCFLPHLRRLDVSSNFTELQELPNSIGHLQSLQDLNISFNHIMVLPDSFGMLTGLQKLTLDGNPWRIPPREVAQQGKEAVLEFMNNLVEQREIERARPPKTGLVSMMTVFRKKNKSKKFSVKDTLDLNIKA
ncbi:unnamed protein product [Sphagnum troendelagicum]|uniref:Disease resistance R13L4/SHOC-2-like LRR domain-containing protein n=1 Tax=Sphagnum troendelagicum TaxID=128251 RepID=A0ABP0UIE6_9BRYO